MTAGAKDVVIFGTGSFARMMQYYLEVDSDYRVVAFTATPEYITADSFSERPLVPFAVVQERFPPAQNKMFVAVGYRKLNRLRAQYYEAAKALGFELITYVSSKAMKWDQGTIGDNCCILEGTIIEPFVRIGNNVVFWSGNHIGHDSSVDDHCFIASDVIIPGFTHIGRHCFLGVNATFRDGITIGEGCLIGAGATILADTNPGEVYLGPRSQAYAGDTTKFLE